MLRVSNALRSATRLIPTRDRAMNHLVAKIPFASPRMAAYSLLGVDLEDHRTGIIMMGAQIYTARGVQPGKHLIGEGAVAAAGAVVTKDVDPFMVVAGVPARPIRERPRDLRYELTWRPDWQ
jgi:hypothetical protein